MTIPKSERGLIRVFAVNRATAEVTQAIDDQGKPAVASDLLGSTVAQEGFELFPTADLSGVGLARYLGDGYAVAPDQLGPAHSKLDALEGYVLLLFSSAFEGRDVTLTPGPDVTLIGTFGEAQPDMTTHALESDAAQAYSGTPRETPPPSTGKRSGGSLVVLLLMGAFAGVVLWILAG